MASYKVPQDVEADDKLIGPFSFRQFIYIIIAILGIAIGWGLSRILIPLAIIPLPVVLLFGALALPLRKDQPMEIYLAAVISFFLKPRKRLWKPDGIQTLVEVVAPRVDETQRSKNLSGAEAEQRLSYLADIVDTRGWSVRGVIGQPDMSDTPMNEDAYYEAQQAPDVLDETNGVARSFDTMISAADTKRHQAMIDKMHQPPQTAQPTGFVIPPTADPYAGLTGTAVTPMQPANNSTKPSPADDTSIRYDPYPNSIHQSVIQPMSEQPPAAAPTPAQAAPTPANTQQPQTTSANTVSPDIINLANNSDLSVETIAREAKRIQDRDTKALEDEVVISLH